MERSEYSLGQIFKSVINTTVPQPIGGFITGQIDIQKQQNLTPASYLTYQLVTKMFNPNAKLSFGNYAMSIGMGNVAYQTTEYQKNRYAASNPDSYAKYVNIKRNVIGQVPAIMTYYGQQAQNIMTGTYTALRGMLTGNSKMAKTGGYLIAGSQLQMVSPTSLGQTFKRAFRDNYIDMQENAVGLGMMYQFKSTFESILQPTVLEQIQGTPEFNKFNARRVSSKRLSNDDQFNQFIYWLRSDKDGQVDQFVRDINNRLGSVKQPESLKKAGFNDVTFLDIQSGKVKYTDISGYMPMENVDPQDVLNKRMQEMAGYLIQRGVNKDTQIGFGIYWRKAGDKLKIYSMPTQGLATLKTLSFLSKNVTIPFMGFNPMAQIQPDLLLEYNYFRPAVQSFESDKYVQTKNSWMQVKEIQSRLLYKNEQSSIKQLAIEYTNRLDQIIRSAANKQGYSEKDLSDIMSGLKQETRNDTFKEARTKLQELLNQQGITDSAVARVISEHMHLMSLVTNKEKPITASVSTLRSVVSAQRSQKVVGSMQYGIGDETKSKLQSISTWQQSITNDINMSIKDSYLVYIGNKPLLRVGKQLFDASKIMPENMIILNKGRMSGEYVEQYAKQTGQMKYVGKETIRRNATKDMPFYNDYNIGESMPEEFIDMFTGPKQYDEVMQGMATQLYDKQKYGYLNSLRRSFTKVPYMELIASRGISNPIVKLNGEMDIEQMSDLINQFEQFGNLSNYQKYMVEKSTGDERKQWQYIANLLEMGDIEQSLYQDIKEMQQSGRFFIHGDFTGKSEKLYEEFQELTGKTDEQSVLRRQEITKELEKILGQPVQEVQQNDQAQMQRWQMQPVGRNGVTRLDVLLSFGTYLNQVTPAIKENLSTMDNMLSNIIDLQNPSDKIVNVGMDFNTSYQVNFFNRKRKELEEQFANILQFDDNENLKQLFDQQQEESRTLKLPDKFKQQVGNQLTSVILEKNQFIDVMQNESTKQQLRYIQGNYMYSTIHQSFDKYNIQNTSLEQKNMLFSVPSTEYIETLQDIFGLDYFHNQIKSATLGIPSFRQIKEVQVERIGRLQQYGVSESEQTVNQKYDILFEKNRYVQMYDIEHSTGGNFLNLLFPNFNTRPESFGKQNIASVTAHWIIGRTTQLLEEIGLGRPNVEKQVNQYEEFQGVARKIGWISAGVQQAGILDQVITTQTGGIINPHETLIEAGKTLQTGGIQIQNMIGIGPVQRQLHETMPGFMQATAGAAGQLLGGTRGFFTLQALGQMAESMPTTKEFQLQTEGVTNVPVYRAQGWEFGREPYWGGKIREFRPSLLYMEGKEWKNMPIMFGSKLEYQVFGQPYPTPLNLFGMIPMFSHHYDKEQLMIRPYARTGNPPGTFELMSNIIPMQNISPIQFVPQLMRFMVPTTNLLDDYTQQLKELGLSVYGSSPDIETVEQYVKQSYLSGQMMQVRQQVGFDNQQAKSDYIQIKQANESLYTEYIKNINYSLYNFSDLEDWMQNYTGFLGFAQSTINPFNQAGESREITLQSSDFQRSSERLYYQQQLGGLMGYTEFYRRLNQSNRRVEYQINPLPNPYMSLNFPWLPDRFLTGDQYQSIDFGEVRLPGQGYEYIRGSLDDYGPVDVYRILSNVAPYQQATDRQEKQAVEIQKDENTDPRIRYMIEQAKEERAQIRKGAPTRERVFTMPMETRQYTLETYLGNGQFETDTGDTVELRGFTSDVDYIAKRIFESKNITVEEAYQQAERESESIETQLQGMVGQTVSLAVPSDAGTRNRFYGNNDIRIQAIQPDLKYGKEQYREDTEVDIRQNYQPNFMNKQWEDFSHRFSFVHEKFIPVRTAKEEYQRYHAYGQYRQLWQHPITDILLPSVMNTFQLNPIQQQTHQYMVGQLAGQNYISRQFMGGMMSSVAFYGSILTPKSQVLPNVQKQREVEEQQIYLEHLQGKKQFNEFKALPSIRTMTRLLPMEDQGIFEELANQPEQDWEDIKKIQPSYMKPMLESVYEQKTQFQQGRKTYKVEQDQADEFVNNVYGNAQRNMPQVIQNNYDIVDVEQYRSLLQLTNVKNLSAMNVYENQIMKQMNGLIAVNSNMKYDPFQSQQYYVLQNNKIKAGTYDYSQGGLR